MTSPSNRLTHSLELDDLALSLLVTSQLKVLASLDGHHSLGPAVGLHTLQPQHNLLCGLGLFAENRLGLSTVTGLFSVISPLTLCVEGILSLLVLGNFVKLVSLALLAVGPACLRHIHLNHRFRMYTDQVLQSGTFQVPLHSN